LNLRFVQRSRSHNKRLPPKRTLCAEPVLHERMEAAGIETDEWLWERFAEVGGERLQRWRFLKNCKGEYIHMNARYIRGVVRVLSYDFDGEEAGNLALSYFGNWQQKDRPRRSDRRSRQGVGNPGGLGYPYARSPGPFAERMMDGLRFPCAL
jgi:hypothetical protein